MRGYTKDRVGSGYAGHSIYFGTNPANGDEKAIHVVEPEIKYIRYCTNKKLIAVPMPYQVWIHSLGKNATTRQTVCNGFGTRMALAQSDPMRDPHAKVFISFMPNTSGTSFCHGDMSYLMEYVQNCPSRADVRRFIFEQYGAYWSTKFNTELEPMYHQPSRSRGLRRFFPDGWDIDYVLSDKFYNEVVRLRHRGVSFSALI